PSGVALRECGVDEARVLLARADQVALVRERGRETAVRREIERRDLDRDTEQGDRVHAVVLPGERGGAFAKREERAVPVFERDEGACETAIRVDVAVPAHELAIGGLGLTEAAAREELRGRVARETMVVRDLGLDRAALLCE